MIELSVDKVRRLMAHPDNIRSISLIAGPNYQSPNIVDALVEHAGIRLSTTSHGDVSVPAAETQQIHEINTKYIPIPLYAQVPRGEGAETDPDEIVSTEYLVNLVDCSDHVSLSPDGRCPTVHNTDGVVIVLDFMTGLSLQAEKVLRQALEGSLRPMMFIDYLEHAFETELSQEDIYQQCVKIIDSVNTVILHHSKGALVDPKLSPSKDNIVFGSTKHNWMFTIGQFARKYAIKFDVDHSKMCERLWGNWFFRSAEKKWHRSGDASQRAFNLFVLGPLDKIYHAYKLGESKSLATLAARLSVTLTIAEEEQSPFNLLKTIMHSLSPFIDTFMESMVRCLPSPKAAQQYRAEDLCWGGPEDNIHRCIKGCDPAAEVLFFVSNVVPSKDKKTSYVIGRVFSGTVGPGVKVRIQGENYIPGRKEDLFIKKIETPVLLLGQNVIPIMDVPAGNYACLAGLSDFVYKGATITTCDSAQNMRWSSRSWASTVQCSLDVVEPKDLPELVSGLKRLAKWDTSIDISITSSGDHFMKGFSEQHLKIRSKELEEYYAGIPLKVSELSVGYRESVRQYSSMTALSKTPNRYSRFWVTAEPLMEDLSRAIEEGKITRHVDYRTRAQTLSNDYGWNEMEARKIWTFGPDNSGANLVVDMTQRVQYLNEIKDSFISGFIWATREGPLAEEPMRSVRLNIMDVGLFSDAIHRGGGQIIPAVRRVTYAATLLADPVLLEPVYNVEIHAPPDSLAQIASNLIKRRGRLVSQHVQTGILESLSLIKAYLPVVEAFDLSNTLHDGLNAPLLPNMVFDHWQAIPGSPWDTNTMAGKIAIDVRTKKGLNDPVPEYSKFYDKL